MTCASKEAKNSQRDIFTVTRTTLASATHTPARCVLDDACTLARVEHGMRRANREVRAMLVAPPEES